MIKTYRYRGLSFNVADEEPVYLEVRFISDGNSGPTVINIPGPHDPEIPRDGTVYIGKGSDLRGPETIIFSVLNNMVLEEDEVRVRYYLNGEFLEEHENKKEESDRPIVVLFVKFPAT